MATSFSGLDPDVVARAQAGGDAERTQVLAFLEPILRAFFIKRVGRKPEVDDLVQNALLRVHTSLADLNDPARLKAFAMKAALFEVQDLYRGRYHAKETFFEPGHLPERSAEGPNLGARLDLERALAVLSPKARRIMELREYGYRYEEIARTIGSTEAAIKMQVKRALERMRAALASLLWAALSAHVSTW
ncbi:MAG: sigma-70 family RNA polymerase sigma factor [Bacteroidota bacterium]